MARKLSQRPLRSLLACLPDPLCEIMPVTMSGQPSIVVDDLDEEEDHSSSVLVILTAAAASLRAQARHGMGGGRKPPRLPWERRLAYLDLNHRCA